MTSLAFEIRGLVIESELGEDVSYGCGPVAEASLSLVKSNIWRQFGGERWFKTSLAEVNLLMYFCGGTRKYLLVYLSKEQPSDSSSVVRVPPAQSNLSPLIFTLAILVLSFNATIYINKKPPDIPEVHSEESKPVLDIAYAMRIVCCEKLHLAEI